MTETRSGGRHSRAGIDRAGWPSQRSPNRSWWIIGSTPVLVTIHHPAESTHRELGDTIVSLM
jgi:hypothetical protein